MERKLLTTLTSDLSIDPDTVENEDLSALFAASSPPSGRRRKSGISRVVVLHDDKLETFCSPNDEDNYVEDEAPKEMSDDFFDTPEFWSGSITWW
jgi:hypothetical protein